MGEHSKIQWTTHTFNPWVGCAKVSDACRNCYAEVNRFVTIQRSKGRELWGPKGDRHVTSDANWRKPLAWDRAAAAAGERHRVFCASLSDVFEDRADLRSPRARLHALIRDTPNLNWLLLTKRPEHAARLWSDAHYDAFNGADSLGLVWPDNVWLGASYDDRGPERADALREIPARVRFLSVEPLVADPGVLDLRGIHWVIGGGEGEGARPCDIAWLRSLRDQCRAASVPYFNKQLGAAPYEYVIEARGYDENGNEEDDGRRVHLTLRDPKGGDPSEWPADLRVRELPESPHA